QSRLASARSPASTETEGQTLRRRSSTSSGTATEAASSRPVTADASPASAIGAVGAPGPGSGRSWGVAMGSGSDQLVERGLGQVRGGALVLHERPVGRGLALLLGVVPPEVVGDQRRHLVGDASGVVAPEQ